MANKKNKTVTQIYAVKMNNDSSYSYVDIYENKTMEQVMEYATNDLSILDKQSTMILSNEDFTYVELMLHGTSIWRLYHSDGYDFTTFDIHNN